VSKQASVAARAGSSRRARRSSPPPWRSGLRELWETSEQQRLIGARIWLSTLAEKGPLRAGLDLDDAVDALWLYMAPDLFHRLVHDRGWSQEHFQTWLTDTLRRLLLPED
jgi:hypothetical protein